MGKLRRCILGVGTMVLCLTGASASVVASAGAASPPKKPSQQRPLTLTVPSDRVSFDITAAGLGPGRQAEVAGGISPAFVFNSAGGWNQVTHVGTGHYCLNTPPGILAFNYPAVVSVANRFGTANVPGALVQYDSFGSGCPGVGVFTYQIVS